MTAASHEQHARIELAALFRMAALHRFHEGIDNHFSLALLDQPGRFLLNPYGPYWTELRARDLLVVAAGMVLYVGLVFKLVALTTNY